VSDFLVVGEESEDFPASTSGRGSFGPLRDKVQEIVNRQDLHRKPVAITGFPEPEKAKAASAVQSLRQKYGSTAEVQGLTFASRKVRPAGSDEDLYGVWVHYDPEAKVEGALARHLQLQKEKVQKQNAAKKAKDAAKAKETRKAS
jgi:hypothetical protein